MHPGYLSVPTLQYNGFLIAIVQRLLDWFSWTIGTYVLDLLARTYSGNVPTLFTANLAIHSDFIQLSWLGFMLTRSHEM